MSPTEIYLGDSVYATYGGYTLVLTTENGHGPTNRIELGPEEIESLNLFIAAIDGKKPRGE